jgi:hypothetical protein
LEAVRNKAERLSSLKLKTEALIEAYSHKAHIGLGLYTPQDKFDAYKALGVRELIVGVLCSNTESLSSSTSMAPSSTPPS